MNRDWPTVGCTGICIDVQFGGGTEPEIVTRHLWPISLGSGRAGTSFCVLTRDVIANTLVIKRFTFHYHGYEIIQDDAKSIVLWRFA
jgi:hypothetical protein